MYIKEITIDGFKSYANRTTVGPFDPQFNAITGLNGSGKSNILDSICFVLGISNLSNVRATGLSDLVYKNGRAGVTRATVSITFDNSNRAQSPIGYENEQEIVVSRQIVVDGKNKYMINGLNATNQRVVDFFRSVQLNVNNPHFLIMQGRITKVLNMKPPEILSMIEEAAGTRMYESKREQAQKTIEKKEEKLKQITDVLTEEIMPKLTSLKEEREAYLQYQEVVRQIELLTKLDVAFQYHQANQKVISNEDEVEKQKEAIENMNDGIVEAMETVEKLSMEAKEIEKQQAAERSSVLKDLEVKWNDKRNAEAKASSECEHREKQHKDLMKKIGQIEKTIKQEKASLEKSNSNVEKMNDDFKSFEEKKSVAEKEVETAQNLVQAAKSGMYANESGNAVSLHEQLNLAKTEKSQANSEIELLERKLKDVKSDLGAKERELSNMTITEGEDEHRCKQLKNEVKKLQTQLNGLGFDKEREQFLRNEIRNLQSEWNELRNKIESLKSRDWRLQFSYRSPGGSFRHESVKGVLATSFDVRDKENQLAIEVAGGGKLFNVVVDNDQTAETLLKYGELKSRTTFVPLNKISGRVCSDSAVRKAKTIAGKDNVHHALELVDYDKEVSKAVEFALGNTLICNDIDKAQNVCYDPQVRTPVVTTQGESFNPDGLLRGGSRPNKESVIAIAGALKEVQMRYKLVDQKLSEYRQELSKMGSKADQFETMTRQLESHTMELQTLQVRIDQGSVGSLRQELGNMRKEASDISTALEENKKLSKTAANRVSELEKMIKNEAEVRQSEMRKSTERQKRATNNLQSVIADYDKLSSAILELKADISAIEKEITANEEELESKKKDVEESGKDVELARDNLTAAKAETSEAKKLYDEKKDLLKQAHAELEKKYKEMQKLTDKNTADKLEVQQMEYKLESIERAGRDARKRIEHLKAKYDWVAKDAQYFGQENSSYDFSRQDMTRVGTNLAKLQKDKDTLSRRVNMRAMSMLEEAERSCEELKKKKNTVLKDKAKLERTMADLDEQKRKALREAIARVNQDFGVILNTLLDYAFAELRPPSGQTELDGLEIRCRFGTVWKESLTELSGGQRSLVAISLILAMLKFNPAPLYILDEIDSALDLSHTQNIGRLIAAKFQTSQFIVVSLKDGLFNNANVLFRTSFVEGVSNVARQAKR